jgi:hypothetical protein
MLTIRAGEGFQPVIKLHPSHADDGKGLLRTNGALSLEGLELQRIRSTPNEPYRLRDDWIVGSGANAPLYVANCRLVATHGATCVQTNKETVAVIQNCELFSDMTTVGWNCSPQGRLTIDNCVHFGKIAVFGNAEDLAGAAIDLRRNTTLGEHCVWLGWLSPPKTLEEMDRKSPMRLSATANIFDAQYAVLRCDQFIDRQSAFDAQELESLLPGVLAWTDDRNLYPLRPLKLGLLGISIGYAPQPTTRGKDLADW